MKDQWTGSNIDLNLLSIGISRFFTEANFETKLEPTENGYKIEAATRKILEQQIQITVDIYGQPNDFAIEFTYDPKKKGMLSRSMIIAYVASAFGGGSILLSELKLKEAIDKLEKMFWEHVDQQVAKLTNSAEKQP